MDWFDLLRKIQLHFKMHCIIIVIAIQEENIKRFHVLFLRILQGVDKIKLL